MKTQQLHKDSLELRFFVPTNQFTALVNTIKRFEGRVFDKQNKIWCIPYSYQNAQKLEKLGFKPEGQLQEILHPHVDIPREPEPQTEVDTSLLPATLRPYQLEAVKFLEWSGWNGMIALSPRTGKSLVAIAGLMLHKYSPTIVITTSMGKPVWKEEFKTWLHKDVQVLHGQTPYEITHAIIIINYEILADWYETLTNLHAEYLIIDECHRVTNPEIYVKKTEDEYKKDLEQAKLDNTPEDKVKKGKYVPVQCTHAYMKLAQHIPHIVPLSGTPATRSASQLQVSLSLLDPEHFGDRMKFLFTYCAPQKTQYGMTFDGVSNEKTFYPLLRRVMFRRTKEEIFDNLPKEQHIFIPCEIDEAEYARELEEFGLRLGDVDDETLLQKLSQFASLSYSSKRKSILEWISNYLDEGNKLVVFSWYRITSTDIYETFKKKAVLVYGGTSERQKEDAVEKFNTDDRIQLFVGQIESCKEAISLYAADTVFYAELPATAGSLQQSSERIWLPSLNREKQTYCYAVAEGTLDYKRVDILKERSRMLGRLYRDGKESYELFT